VPESDWEPLVPHDFVVPNRLATELFVLEPLELRHNEADRAAWTSSIEHIRSTPGFAGRAWPHAPVSLRENALSISKHLAHAERRVRFTYAVIEAESGTVIGSVYLYPPRRPGHDVDVRSWVSTRYRDLDAPLYSAVRSWLQEAWPFRHPDYAERR
jgi:RimJ/RimL family protein N-acetyltransferase